MKKGMVFSILVFFTLYLTAQPLQVKVKHTIIIDTDCAYDDMRAISLMLSRPELTIKAILVSDGTLLPADGAGKIRSLLNEFNKNYISVAMGETLKGVNPAWRATSREIIWGKKPGNFVPGALAVDCLAEKLDSADEKIILVCLGPLTNIAGLIKKAPSKLLKVEKIIWYNDSLKPLQGFNYECDKEATDIVFKSKVRIDIISNLNYKGAVLDSSMYNVYRRSGTKLGSVLDFVCNQPLVLDGLRQNHYMLYDDLLAIYLTNPELFGINTMTDKLNVRYNQSYNLPGVKEAINDMITGKYITTRNVVFNRFPDQREMFNYDVRPIVDSAIALYGYDEWKANVMTDEFHGHLGVFSIVGAKMGIKARDLFGVGPDMLEVTTFAGSRPPYSCLTDGIQVSTGATLGMGTIHLAADTIARPEAVFKYKNRSIRISLKKEYLAKVDADINEGIVKFGLMDDGYWKLIRYNALKYWLEWDRNKIFDIVETSRKE
jgi:pyrimidine-specific ribonucleoside hydrolase